MTYTTSELMDKLGLNKSTTINIMKHRLRSIPRGRKIAFLDLGG